MGAKRAKRQLNITNNSSNVVKLNNFTPAKTRQIQLIPRNRNQENYILQLLDPEKDIVFGIGPAGTGKTMLACQSAVKNFLEGNWNLNIYNKKNFFCCTFFSPRPEK